MRTAGDPNRRLRGFSRGTAAWAGASEGDGRDRGDNQGRIPRGSTPVNANGRTVPAIRNPGRGFMKTPQTSTACCCRNVRLARASPPSAAAPSNELPPCHSKSAHRGTEPRCTDGCRNGGPCETLSLRIGVHRRNEQAHQDRHDTTRDHQRDPPHSARAARGRGSCFRCDRGIHADGQPDAPRDDVQRHDTNAEPAVRPRVGLGWAGLGWAK